MFFSPKKKIIIILILINLAFFGPVLIFAQNQNSSRQFSTQPPLPRTPQGFSVQTGPNSSLKITWQENPEWDIFSYVLYVRQGEEKEGRAIFVGKTDNFLLENLDPEITYYLSLSARNMAGEESKPTPEIGISPEKEQIQKDFSIAAWISNHYPDEAQKSLEDNLEIFDQISPFEYKVEEDGKITRTAQILREDLKEKLKAKSIKIIPTITNNSDENDKASKILSEEEKRKEHQSIILKEVEEQNYDGIDIDYENLKEEVRDNFTQFIQELAEALHSKGKILSVTLQAKTSDFDTGRGPGALDFEMLGKFADEVRLMIYDFSRPTSAPGSISPIRWVSQVIDYAKTKISPEKIIAGLPNYAYRWCLEKKTEECESKGLVWEGVKNIIEKYKPEVRWNATTKTPWFLYEDENQNKFAVNFENYQSLEEKLRLVKMEEIGGIIFWQLGGEDPENYKIVRNQLISQIGPPKKLKIQPDNNSLHFEWENPEDKDIKGYRIIIKSKVPENLTNQNKPYSKEETFDVIGKTSYDLENLENNKPYYISFLPLLWSEDINPSLQRRETQESKPIFATPSDLIPPSQILDLKIEEIGTTSLKLNFTAPGDDKNIGQAKRYELHKSTKPLNSDNFWEATKVETPAPEVAGTKQEILVSDLEPGEKYYFGLVAFDEAENYSLVSNIVSAQTIDNLPPKIPSPPQVIPGNQSLLIKWAKNQEKDLAGYKIYFRQEKSYYQTIIVGAETTSYTLKNLENGYRYFVALSAFDRFGNESAKSEDTEGKPQANNFYEKAKNLSSRSYEILRGQAIIFGKKLISPEAVPYLIMFSIIILNLIIYRGLHSEIKEKIDEKIIPRSFSYSKPNTPSLSHKPSRPRVIDLKKEKWRMILK